MERAEPAKKAFKEAKLEYHEVMTICRVTEEKYSDPYNRQFFDKLLDEIPDTDLEGNKIKKLRSIHNLELPRGKKVDEDYIAGLRYKNKMAYLHYVRKRNSWQQLYTSVLDSVQHPITFKQEDLKKRSALMTADYMNAQVDMSRS